MHNSIFLPFIKVDCGGMEIKTITGTQLAFGFEYETMKGLFETKKEKVKPEIFATLAFITSIVGVGISLAKLKKSELFKGILSLLLIIFLIALKTEIDEESSKQGMQGLIEYQWPFWTIIVLSGINIILSIIPITKIEKEQIQQEVQNKYKEQ